MMKYAIAALALAAAAEATFVIGTVATTGTAVTLSAATTTSLALLGGVALLKGLVLGAALSRRGKRSAEEDQDAAFAVLAAAEPAQCYRRLICDLSAGVIPDNDKIAQLFNGEVSVVSPKFEYVTAAKVGKLVKSAQICEVRYSCPLNTQEIQKLFN
jgi:hypothetical protein